MHVLLSCDLGVVVAPSASYMLRSGFPYAHTSVTVSTTAVYDGRLPLIITPDSSFLNLPELVWGLMLPFDY